ncbi:MAG: hypothetical protein J0I28_09475, partial [Caulobacterales bacterium]|nr:hypothetical protein [Caulobacterales bacterium]
MSGGDAGLRWPLVQPRRDGLRRPRSRSGSLAVALVGVSASAARRGPSDLDIDLADGTGDEAYLAQLAAILPALLDRVAPDLIFYIAGVDPHESDRLGRLALTDAGLAARDA